MDLQRDAGALGHSSKQGCDLQGKGLRGNSKVSPPLPAWLWGRGMCVRTKHSLSRWLTTQVRTATSTAQHATHLHNLRRYRPSLPSARTCFCCAAASREVTSGGRPSLAAATFTVAGPGPALRPAAALLVPLRPLPPCWPAGEPSPWSPGNTHSTQQRAQHTATTRGTTGQGDARQSMHHERAKPLHCCSRVVPPSPQAHTKSCHHSRKQKQTPLAVAQVPPTF